MTNEKEGMRKGRNWFKESNCGEREKIVRRGRIRHSKFRKSSKKALVLNMPKNRPHALNMYIITGDSPIYFINLDVTLGKF